MTATMTVAPGVRRLYRVVSDDGTAVWAEMPPEMMAEIRRHDARQAKREYRRKRREKSFSEVGIDPAAVGDRSSWEGPRYRFTWLVGESRTWDGEPCRGSRCSFCGAARLPAYAYCLGCDRSGRDRDIPTVGEDELARKRVRTVYEPGPLQGGKG